MFVTWPISNPNVGLKIFSKKCCDFLSVCLLSVAFAVRSWCHCCCCSCYSCSCCSLARTCL